MSAVEVIEQIKHLPFEEQRTIYAYLRDHLPEGERTRNELGPQVSDEFKQIADEVFTKNTEMFRKLAD